MDKPDGFVAMASRGMGRLLCTSVFYKLAEEVIEALIQRARAEGRDRLRTAALAGCLRGVLPRSEFAGRLLAAERVHDLFDQGFVVFDAAPLRGPEFWAALREEVARLEVEVCRPSGEKYSMHSNICTRHKGYHLPVAVLGGDAASSLWPALTDVVAGLHGCAAEVASHPEAPLHMRQLCVPQTFMISDYGPGDHYRRHLDSYGPEENPRGVTLLLYINGDWAPGDGGVLQGYYDAEDPEPSFTVEPRMGMMCAFLARDVWHEVTEACAGPNGSARPRRKAIQYWIHFSDE